MDLQPAEHLARGLGRDRRRRDGQVLQQLHENAAGADRDLRSELAVGDHAQDQLGLALHHRLDQEGFDPRDTGPHALQRRRESRLGGETERHAADVALVHESATERLEGHGISEPRRRRADGLAIPAHGLLRHRQPISPEQAVEARGIERARGQPRRWPYRQAGRALRSGTHARCRPVEPAPHRAHGLVEAVGERQPSRHQLGARGIGGMARGHHDEAGLARGGRGIGDLRGGARQHRRRREEREDRPCRRNRASGAGDRAGRRGRSGCAPGPERKAEPSSARSQAPIG